MILSRGAQPAGKIHPAFLRSFFCAAASPINLAVFRIALFGWLLYVIFSTDFLGLVDIPADLRVAPSGLESLLPLIPIDAPWVIMVRRVALLACTMALVGKFTRVSAWLACLCALYLLGLPELFGKIYRQHQHLVWFAALLAAARSGDALSIDAVVSRWRRVDRGASKPPRPSVAYALPLRFVWLLIGVIYLFPGLAKLAAGPEWFLSDNVKYLMYSYWSAKDFVPGFRLDHYPLLYQSGALATIVFETTFILCVFSARLRWVAVVGGVLFHFVTAAYLGLVFFSLVVCYAAFVDWQALFEHLGLMSRPPASVFANGTDASHPDTVARERFPSAVAIVGSVLLIANIYCGVRHIESWPFSIYPEFGEVVRRPVRRSLEVTVHSILGDVRPRRISIPEGVVNRILETRDATERARYLGGVRVFIVRRAKLKPEEVAQVFEIERSVLPDDANRDPLRRELLLEFAGGG